MRILMTTDTVGGVWTFTKELCQEFLLNGHSVALVSFGRAPKAEQNRWCANTAHHYEKDFVYYSTTIPLEWMKANSSSYSAAEGLLLKLADSFAPDIFHSNQYCFGKLPIDVPKLITAHSDVLSWADSCCSGGLEKSAWLTQYKSLVEEGLELADALSAPTRWMLQALERHFPIHPPAKVILNGRNLPATAYDDQRSLQALCVGRLWDKGKNLALLTSTHFPLPIYAIGERQLDEAIALGNTGCTTLLGPMVERDLLSQMRKSSIYIAPSVYEPFGLAPLEAGLCGCALLLNDIPSFHEVWKDAAIYFDSAEKLTELLWQLKSSPESLLLARKKSYKRARQLTASRMAAAYLSFYKELQETKKLSVIQEIRVNA